MQSYYRIETDEFPGLIIIDHHNSIISLEQESTNRERAVINLPLTALSEISRIFKKIQDFKDICINEENLISKQDIISSDSD